LRVFVWEDDGVKKGKNLQLIIF